MAKKKYTIQDFHVMREKIEKDTNAFLALIGTEFLIEPFIRAGLSIVVDADQTTWKVLNSKHEDVTATRTVKAAFMQIDLFCPYYSHVPLKRRVIEALIQAGNL